MTVLVAVLLGTVAGCRGAGGISRVLDIKLDLRLLDCVPVVPIQTSSGTGSMLILPDGSGLTCSHVLPRDSVEGEALMAGRPVHYQVQRSGDGLVDPWRTWSATEGFCPSRDWAVIVSKPPIHASEIFGSPIEPAFSAVPPAPGETVYIVGYTVHEAQFVRKLVPALVIDAPASAYRSFGPSVIWLRSASPASSGRPGRGPAQGSELGAGRSGAITHGLSGSPVLRHTGGGALEVCALLVGVETLPDGTASAVGAAIPLPDGFLDAAFQARTAQ